MDTRGRVDVETTKTESESGVGEGVKMEGRDGKGDGAMGKEERMACGIYGTGATRSGPDPVLEASDGVDQREVGRPANGPRLYSLPPQGQVQL